MPDALKNQLATSYIYSYIPILIIHAYTIKFIDSREGYTPIQGKNNIHIIGVVRPNRLQRPLLLFLIDSFNVFNWVVKWNLSQRSF